MRHPAVVASCFVAVLAIAARPSVACGQTNPADVPRPPETELRRFEPFLGRWAMTGHFASVHWVGVTEVRTVVKGWYVEWVNDLVGAGIQRELRMLMGFDRQQRRYRVWRFETTDRGADFMDTGSVGFEADTLVQRWQRRDSGGRFTTIENRFVVARDSLHMLTFSADSGDSRRLVGHLAGPRLGVSR